MQLHKTRINLGHQTDAIRIRNSTGGKVEQDPRILKRRKPRKPTVVELQRAEDTLNRLIFRMKDTDASKKVLVQAKTYLFKLAIREELKNASTKS